MRRELEKYGILPRGGGLPMPIVLTALPAVQATCHEKTHYITHSPVVRSNNWYRVSGLVSYVFVQTGRVNTRTSMPIMFTPTLRSCERDMITIFTSLDNELR